MDTLNEWYSKNLFECYVRTIYNLDISYIDYSDSLKPFGNTLRAYAQDQPVYAADVKKPDGMMDELF